MIPIYCVVGVLNPPSRPILLVDILQRQARCGYNPSKRSIEGEKSQHTPQITDGGLPLLGWPHPGLKIIMCNGDWSRKVGCSPHVLSFKRQLDPINEQQSI